jgi:Cysteine-rich secretory protein family
MNNWGNNSKVKTRRFGHLMAVFGVFLALVSLSMQSVNPLKTIAFGTGEIIDLSNQYRVNAGLPQLSNNQTLTNSAQAKANDMAAKGYFAHNSPDGSVPWDFFAAAGYSYSGAGENLALTDQSASSVVTGWYNSELHRANMLSGEFTEVGYGMSLASSVVYNGTTYHNVYVIAAHYGTPLYQPAPEPSPTPPLIANNTGSNTPPQSQPNTPAHAAADLPAVEQPKAEPIPEPKPIAATTPDTKENKTYPNTTTSGRYIGINKTGFTLDKNITTTMLGVGISMAIAGIFVEIRRIARHQPLVPHIHHHA